MERNIDKSIDNWIKESKKALLIYKARQVGKTYSIRDALKKNHAEFLEIHFSENPELSHSKMQYRVRNHGNNEVAFR